MTGITCALAGSGGSEYLGEAEVTVGYAEGGDFFSFGFDIGGQGSIDPATWANSELPFAQLKDVYFEGEPAWLAFQVSGSAPNSGWETLTVDGTTIDRVDASYSNNGTFTTWIFIGAPTVFGDTVGDTRFVEWA
jgi:hypothetical protein